MWYHVRRCGFCSNKVASSTSQYVPFSTEKKRIFVTNVPKKNFITKKRSDFKKYHKWATPVDGQGLPAPPTGGHVGPRCYPPTQWAGCYSVAFFQLIQLVKFISFSI